MCLFTLYYVSTFGGAIGERSRPEQFKRRELNVMNDQRKDSLYERLVSKLEEMEGWESVQAALNKTLPNDSDKTDYDKWNEGAKR